MRTNSTIMFQWKFSFLFFSFFPRIFLFFCSLTAHWGFPLGKPLYEALSTVRLCSYKGSSLFAVWPFVYMRKNWFVGHLQALKASRLKIILKYQWCPRASNKFNNLCCKNCTVKMKTWQIFWKRILRNLIVTDLHHQLQLYCIIQSSKTV